VHKGKATGARTALWLACSMWALSLALTALSLLLLILSLSHRVNHIYDHWLEDTLFGMSFSTIGAVIISRSDPKNPIGWLFCVTGLCWAVSHFVAQYAIYTLLAAPGTLPAGEAAAWIYSWLYVPNFGFVVFLLLLFPDGGLPSRGWRWFAWLSVLLILVGTVLGAFSSGPVNVGLGPIHNPLGIEGLPNVYKSVETLALAFIFVAVASLFVRLHRARGEERQQVKWFAYAFALAVGGAILTYTVSEVIGGRWLEWAGFVVMTVGVLGVPIAMGIAIMRYHLYAIDIIINRTLVYGSLTAMLAAVYLGSVVLLQYIFRALTGQGSTFAVVASTLVIAALFNPLRRRIQRFIDRRFYRRKYDARKSLEAFSAKLRDETDLDALRKDLVGVVQETMQPAHVSLWLHPDPALKDKKKRADIRESGHKE
jgi:hypothetical protein